MPYRRELPVYPPDADRQLLAQAVGGDRTALERLLLTHYAALSQHVEAKMPGALRAAVGVEDILQETFIHVFRDIGRYEPLGESSFLAWLRRIADHRLNDALKSLARKKRGGGQHRVLGPSADVGGPLVDLAEWLTASGPTPSRSAARHEAVEAVQVAMAGLPPDYREVLRLRYFEGQTVEQTAAAMRRSPGAVRGLIDRAKEKLRDAIGRSSRYLSSR